MSTAKSHYSEPLRAFVRVGMPIRHPLSRQLQAAPDLACPARDADRLMLSTGTSWQRERLESYLFRAVSQISISWRPVRQRCRAPLRNR